VPNIKEAVKFYSEVMGWYIIMEPSTVKKKETAIGQMCIDVLVKIGKNLKLHLATSDGIGIELFSFPVKEAPEFNPFNTGLFTYKIQTLKTSSLKLYLMAENKECLFENIIQKKTF
jgi:hypothetical protein